jgi:murein DD-endopeptidase MepM/ murein hydrolase activator NlpD
MTRRTGFLLLGIGLLTFCLCAVLVGYRVISHRKASGPAVVFRQPGPPAGEAPAPGPISTIIDLPGDPVLVRRSTSVAPRSLGVALPASLAANAPRVESVAYFVNAPLVSTTGGFMGKFPEAAEGAEVADAKVLSEEAPVAVDISDAMSAGLDDDGGDATPDAAQAPPVVDLDSTELEASIGANGQAQIREAIIRVVVQEKLSELLIRNGFTEESARAVEAASKAAFNIQSLPPSSVAIADGALDATGAYRVTQVALYENKEYVGAIALAEAGGYGEGAQPSAPPGVLEEGAPVDISVRYTLADGVYSAGVRNNVPEPVVREAIRLIGKLTDLKTLLQPEDNIRVLYARDFRGKSKLSGKVIYAGLSGPSGAVDCYSFQSPDGGFQCFDAKAGGTAPANPQTPPLPPAKTQAPPPGGGGAPAAPGRVFPPIRGAPVTSLFGMRFHPILHIMRLHAGIDFGAPVGSPVRAVADGKVEIAGPVSGFGNHVRLQHNGFETSYSLLSEILAGTVVGASVTRGQVIALSGNTGLSTGPHLHFEYYLDRVAVDPMPHMGPEVGVPAVASLAGAAPVIVVPPARPSEQDLAAFASAKALIDSALQLAAGN